MHASPSLHTVPFASSLARQVPAPSHVSGLVQSSSVASPQADALASNWHVELQQSPLSVLPSSQSSPNCTIELPQTSLKQFESQPSPSSVLLSSHCSPGSVTPLPQADGTTLNTLLVLKPDT